MRASPGGRAGAEHPKLFSYLKIAEGCDNHCTYCAIPLIRGGYRSRKMEDILAEAEKLAQWGVKELMVIAQDTTRYGEDLYGEGKLPQLLTELCKVERLRWIRVLYCYPERITGELLEVMAKEDKILKYMDLPLQHCSRQVLRAMNRQGDRESLSALIPGKSVRRCLASYCAPPLWWASQAKPRRLLRNWRNLPEMRFERMGCYCLFRRKELRRQGCRIQSPGNEEHRRELIWSSDGLMDEMSREMVGKTITVLNEGWDRYAECCFGRSAADAPEIDTKVFFTVEGKKPYPGMFVQVEITDTMDCDLIGQVVTT
ncbi:MAG: radical SAM protein [Oscillospiraceae bacterium]